MPIEVKTQRKVSAILCAIWMTYGIARGAAWLAGHPGDTISLTFAIAAGTFGFIGLVVLTLGRRR